MSAADARPRAKWPPLGRGRRRALRAGRGRRRAGRGRGLLLRRVLAVVGHVALAAVGLGLPPVAVVLAERLQRLLLVGAGEDLLDRGLGLVEGLLLGGRDLGDREDVPAELGLDGAGDLALGRCEDGGVQGLLLLALGHACELAALPLGGLVGRGLL